MLKDLVRYEDGKYASAFNIERSQCLGKHPFETKALARAVAKRERGHRQAGYGAYQCKTCGQWHIGHGKLSER